MTIPASRIVEINPRVTPGGSSNLEINGLFLTKSTSLTANAQTFGSADAVAEVFGTDSDEYDAAVVYFNGYVGKAKTPTAITFGKRTNGSIAADMTAIREISENWVTFSTIYEADTDEAKALGAWAASNYGFVYIAWSEDSNGPKGTETSDFFSEMKAAGYDNVATVFGDEQYAAFLMGIAASIDYYRQNGAITFAFKRSLTLPANCTSISAADALDNKKANYIGAYATRNADFSFLQRGVLVNSDYGFIDPLVNSIWLNNFFQVACMDGFQISGRVPYTDEGYGIIRAWLMDPINAAIRCGVVEPGVQLSEAQKAEVMREVGKDVSSELFTTGFYLYIADPGAQIRAQRGSPEITCLYTYGGSVQKITMLSSLFI